MFPMVMPLSFLMLGGIGFAGGGVLINRARLRSRAWHSAVSAAGAAMNALFLNAPLIVYRLCPEEADVLHNAIAAAIVPAIGFHRSDIWLRHGATHLW